MRREALPRIIGLAVAIGIVFFVTRQKRALQAAEKAAALTADKVRQLQEQFQRLDDVSA